MPSLPHRTSSFVPRNIIALDQEQHALHAVINGSLTVAFDPATGIDLFPDGGGYVIADANAWSVRNPLSQSQYCWETLADRDAFIAAIEALGYKAVVVANKLANTLWKNRGYTQADAVRALYAYAHEQVSDPKGRTAPVDAGALALPCGCPYHWTFDSGRPVGSSSEAPDRSYGERAKVTRAFLLLQNDKRYDTPFVEDVITTAWAALDKEGRKVFGLQERRAHAPSPNRLLAVASCTHDPFTGELRTREDGKKWGIGFICDRVIGLNGTMRGTGSRAPGNPMRAVLRILGKRKDDKVCRTERAALDRHVRVLIRALQAHGPMRPAVREA